MQSNKERLEKRDTFFAAKNTDTLLCKNCCAEIKPEHAKFCLHCGTRVGEDTRVEYVQNGKFSGLPKIEGGLIAVGLFLIVSILYDITTIVDSYTLNLYGWGSFSDLVKACFVFVFDLGAVYLFMRRNKYFPRFFYFISGYKMFIFAVALYQQYFMFDTDKLFLSACECVLYVFFSIYIGKMKRTKVTFTQ